MDALVLALYSSLVQEPCSGFGVTHSISYCSSLSSWLWLVTDWNCVDQLLSLMPVPIQDSSASCGITTWLIHLLLVGPWISVITENGQKTRNCNSKTEFSFLTLF